MNEDPYGLSEYTEQSAVERSRPSTDSTTDVRGNALLKPRSIPTQQEADALKGEL